MGSQVMSPLKLLGPSLTQPQDRQPLYEPLRPQQRAASLPLLSVP